MIQSIWCFVIDGWTWEWRQISFLRIKILATCADVYAWDMCAWMHELFSVNRRCRTNGTTSKIGTRAIRRSRNRISRLVNWVIHVLAELRMKLLQPHALSTMTQVNHALGTPWELNPTWLKELRVPVHTEVQVRFQGRNTSAATKCWFNRRSYSHKTDTITVRKSISAVIIMTNTVNSHFYFYNRQSTLFSWSSERYWYQWKLQYCLRRWRHRKECGSGVCSSGSSAHTRRRDMKDMKETTLVCTSASPYWIVTTEFNNTVW